MTHMPVLLGLAKWGPKEIIQVSQKVSFNEGKCPKRHQELQIQPLKNKKQGTKTEINKWETAQGEDGTCKTYWRTTDEPTMTVRSTEGVKTDTDKQTQARGKYTVFQITHFLTILQCRRLQCSRFIVWRINLDSVPNCATVILHLPWVTTANTNKYVHLARNRITHLVWKNVTMTFHHR